MNSYEITGPDVAQLIEVLQHMQKASSINKKPVKKIALARTCYDHLAGKLGVSVFNSLVRTGAVIYDHPVIDPACFSKEISLGTNAEKTFKAFGVDLTKISRTHRKYAYACLDWTEKKPHLAGTLGAAVYHNMLNQKWITQHEEKRVIRITNSGQKALKEIIDLDFWVS